MNKENKKILNELYLNFQRQKYPNVPKHCLSQKYTKTDNSTNGLTSCIIDFLLFNGHEAERINTMGRYIDNSKIVENVLGQKIKVGSGQYIPTTGVKGRADITAKIKISSMPYPIAVEIEVKFGKDRMSDAQKKYQERMQNVGTPYLIATNFDEFLEWYNNFVK